MVRLKNKGFTLIEIIIALAIFAIIAAVTTTVLYTVFSTRDTINQHSDRLAHMQVAVTLMQRDFQQIVDRPVIDINGIVYPALIAANNRIEFTRGGKPNPFGILKQSSFERVAYYLSGKQLIRETRQDIDMIGFTHVAIKVLLKNINSLTFGYIGQGSAINSSWPPPKSAVVSGRQGTPIPRAVQVKMVIDNWGDMSLLFAIPSTTF